MTMQCPNMKKEVIKQGYYGALMHKKDGRIKRLNEDLTIDILNINSYVILQYIVLINHLIIDCWCIDNVCTSYLAVVAILSRSLVFFLVCSYALDLLIWIIALKLSQILHGSLWNFLEFQIFINSFPSSSNN